MARTKAKSKNPFDPIVKTWRLMERIAIGASILLVAGTIGYVSYHTLV